MQRLKGKRVYFDVNIFIYAVEPTPDMSAYFAKVSKLFAMAVNQEFFALTSELTLAETLVGAYKQHTQLVDLYEAMISQRADLSVFPVDRQILKTASLLRSRQKIALADAIHLATALINQADFLLSHDKRLQTSDTVQKLTLDDLQMA